MFRSQMYDKYTDEDMSTIADNSLTSSKDMLSSCTLNAHGRRVRSEEHTFELQSPRINSYAVSCLKKKKTNKQS